MKKTTILCLLAAALTPAAAIAADKNAPVVSLQSLPAPKPGKGQVVFFRPGGMGAAIKCTVRENGAMIGRVSGNRYFVVDAEPGVHTYTAKSEATDAVTVQVEPDETSFVKCKITMGMMVGRPNLSPATDSDFAKDAGKFKQMEAAKLAAEIAEDQSKQAKAARPAEGGAQ